MWQVYDQELKSRLLLGTSRYPSPEILQRSIAAAECDVVTVSLRRLSPQQGGGDSFWELLRSSKVRILPNTAGCRAAREAVATAHLARELFDTRWIKLEVIGYEGNLAPDPFGLVEAAATLIKDGFQVFPYTTTDVVVAEKLLDVGCQVLMPWGSPIGSGQGIIDPMALKTLRHRFPNVPLIVDAGIGKPSHAATALELGADAVLVNTAVALATDPVKMAEAFRLAVQSGREAYLGGVMEPRDTAVPSTPTFGMPFGSKS